MILEVIMYVMIQIMGLFAPIFPGGGQVPLLLPWGLDGYFQQGIVGYRMLANVFPPFNTVLTAFTIYLIFRIGIRLLRAVPILGRTID